MQAMQASLAHRIANCKEPHTIAEELSTAAVNGEPYDRWVSMVFRACCNEIQVAYRSKFNVEKEISSLISRFEKMCSDQQAHPSHK